MPTITYRIKGVRIEVTCSHDEFESTLAVIERRAVAAAQSSPSLLQGLARAMGSEVDARTRAVAVDMEGSNDAPEGPDEGPVTAETAALDGDSAYVRKEIVKQELAAAGAALSPKKIADRLRQRSDFTMSSKDWTQAVRYILTRSDYKSEFRAISEGLWWLADEALPHPTDESSQS